MGLLKEILRKSIVQQRMKPEVSGKCVELLKWEKWLARLRDTDHYISRKEYLTENDKFSDIMQLF